VSGLSARRDWMVVTFREQVGAVAEREDVRVERRFERLLDDEEIAFRHFQAVELAENVRPFYAGCPDNQFRRDEFAGLQRHALVCDLGDE